MSNRTPSYDIPRIQPHDDEAERAILGAVLLDPSALTKAQELLTPSDFYGGRNRRIFEAMASLAHKSEVIDLLTVGNALDEAGHLSTIGGRGGLAELLMAVPSAANIGHHCRIVREHALRRGLIKVAVTIHIGAYEKEPAHQLLQNAERQLLELATGREERNWCPLSRLASETIDHIDQLSKHTGALVGIPTGYQALDILFGGWQRSDLVIVAARPSMGKTSFALGSALTAAEAGYRVGFVSLEMSRLQLGLRIHGMSAPIDIHALKNGTMTRAGWNLLAATAQRLESLLVCIDDTPVLTVERLMAKARHLKAMQGLDLLVLDYLQLLQLPDAETRQQGIADASRNLKLLAKELDIPVLVLSQLSRACELRDDKRPFLADLRDSGAIEQDADVVLFLYREAVYNPDTQEKETTEILVRKHRNGPIGDRHLRFVERYSRFEDLEQYSGETAIHYHTQEGGLS